MTSDASMSRFQPGGRQGDREVVELHRSMLQPNNPVEFRTMLLKIKDVTGLSFGQIGMRAGASRSTMHSLTSTKIKTLPRRELVIQFIAGCGLNKVQGEIVLGQLRKLEMEEEQQRARQLAPATTSSVATSSNDYVMSKLSADLRQILRDGGDWTVENTTEGQSQVINIRVERGASKWSTAGRVLRLVQWILEDWERVQHAVRLLLTLTLLVVVIATPLVFLVITTPSTAIPIAAAISVMLVVGVLAARRARRPRSGRDPAG